jgi:CRP-like cAMP-binding protein
MLVMSITTVIYASVTSIPLAILLVFISGFMNAPMNIGARLIGQRNTTREIRGRVASVRLVISNILFMVGMSMAGLADVFDVRTMMLVAGLMTLVAAAVSFVILGLGQPAAQWKRSIALLRQVETAPGLAAGRPATSTDLEALSVYLPVFGNLTANQRQSLAAKSWVQEAADGTAVLRHHQISDDAYFIINGRAVAGREEDGSYRVLEVLNCGDFFGEIAALTNAPRTANVVAEEPTTLLQVPARTLREMSKIPELNRLFMSKMTERMIRMNMIDISINGALDQQSLRELRTPTAQAA